MMIMSILIILPQTFSEPGCTTRTKHLSNHCGCRQDQKNLGSASGQHPDKLDRGARTQS